MSFIAILGQCFEVLHVAYFQDKYSDSLASYLSLQAPFHSVSLPKGLRTLSNCTVSSLVFTCILKQNARACRLLGKLKVEKRTNQICFSNLPLNLNKYQVLVHVSTAQFRKSNNTGGTRQQSVRKSFSFARLSVSATILKLV